VNSVLHISETTQLTVDFRHNFRHANGKGLTTYRR